MTAPTPMLYARPDLTLTNRITFTRPVWHLVSSWFLLLPMIFFVVGGQFSFQTTSRNVAGGTSLRAISDSNIPGERLGLFITYGVILASVILSRARIRAIAMHCKGIVCICALCIISTCWSQLPDVTVVRSLYYLLDTVFAWYLLATITPARLREYLRMLGVVVVCCSAVLAIVFPEYGLVHQLVHTGAVQGIFNEKNLAGKVLVFLLTPGVDFSERMTIRRFGYMLLLCTFIGLTQSRTAWAIALLYILFMYFLHILSRLDSKSRIATCSMVICGVALLAIVMGPHVSMLLDLLGRDSTLTGRTQIWTMLADSLSKRPLFGFGYSAFWTGLSGESGMLQMSMGWAFSYAHNGYLEVLLQVGIIGLGVVLLVGAVALKNGVYCFQRMRSADVNWYIGLLLITVIYNVDEETLLFPHQFASLCFIIACCGLGKTAFDLRTARQQAAVSARSYRNLE